VYGKGEEIVKMKIAMKTRVEFFVPMKALLLSCNAIARSLLTEEFLYFYFH
jgi:hypothetical protein